MINYAEQNSDQLHLYVVAGDSNIEQFEVIEQKTITTPLGDVFFGILSESHFVAIQTDDYKITEICACTTGSFETTPVISGNLQALPQTVAHTNTNWAYTFEQTRHSILTDQVQISKHENTLSHTFPSGESSGPAPVTIVGFTVSDSKIEIESIHSYPDEQLFVRTKSCFTFTK